MNYKEFFTTNNKSGWKCQENRLKNNEPIIYNLVIGFSSHIPNTPFKQKVWLFINQINTVPTCLECGGDVRYRNITLGYQIYCGVKCSNKNVIKQEKTKEVLLTKYGSDTTFKIDFIKDKIKETNIAKFGVDNVFKSKVIQDNIKENNIIKYGFNTPAKNEGIKDKIKATNLIRYGFESHLSNEKVRDKIKESITNKFGVDNYFKLFELQENCRGIIFDKYGVVNIMELDETKNKIIKTNIEKYGVNWFLQLKVVRDKVKATNLAKYGDEVIFRSQKFRNIFLNKSSEIEKTVATRIGGEKFVLSNKEFDIRVGSDLFEVDGDYFHPSKLENLSLIQVSSAINDKTKIDLVKDSDFKLYKIKVSEINKLKEISINNLKEVSYQPDYSLVYKQKIITKEFFKDYIEVKGREKLKKYVPLLLKFIRKFQVEFPYPDCYENISEVTSNIRDFDYTKFHNKEENIFRNKTSYKGCNLLKSSFKSFWNSAYEQHNLSPIDIWNDDEKMLKIIAYRIGINNSNEVFDFSLNELIKGISAIRGTISFFKPIVAGGVYKHYLDGIENPRVFDPCCGFGGRLLGFKSVYPNGSYIGCEPNVVTYNELVKLGSNFSDVIINNVKLEEYKNEIEYDLCFTSIPYYNLENYKNGVEYSSFEDWENKFIKPLLEYKNLVINMPYDLCVKLGLEKYIDGYLENSVSHFSKNKTIKREVLIKMNF